MLCRMIRGKLRFIPYACIFTQVVGFEVITLVVMKRSVFWDITACSLLKVNCRFGGTCHLHLHG
jgi:hypothetical protein